MGERGDLAAFKADEDRVVRFLQAGYRAGRPPSVEETVAELGKTGEELKGVEAEVKQRFYQFGR